MREYLEIKSRILVLNERCEVFLDLADILSDSIADSNMSRMDPSFLTQSSQRQILELDVSDMLYI